jgi:hypothetical protein
MTSHNEGKKERFAPFIVWKKSVLIDGVIKVLIAAFCSPLFCLQKRGEQKQ